MDDNNKIRKCDHIKINKIFAKMYAIFNCCILELEFISELKGMI